MKKRPADIIILHNYTKNYEYRLYRFWDMARDECNFYSSFWTVFCSFTPLTAQKNQHFKTNEKNASRYHHFTHVYQKLWLDEVRFLRYGAQRTDRQTGRRYKWHTEVGAPPKNMTQKNTNKHIHTNNTYEYCIFILYNFKYLF